MYLEKRFVLDKIEEYCRLNKVTLNTDEKYQLATDTLRELDKERVLNYDSFMDLLNHNIDLDNNKDIIFDDEIISIDYIGEGEMYDIDVTGDHLYYANGLLTHNSATNNLDADNSAVADSIGTVQTADFLCFLLQTEELKERNEVVFKITKNRFNGRTDYFNMNIDYKKMKFRDVLVQSNPDTQKETESLINTALEVERIAAIDAVKNSFENWE